ncbi:MAG: ABC transporter ATP-binding protein [Phycisphaeraceae bacterium]|nr:ABC transporter ATP-binding protein [Phycisphaeraceae bacterium]
MGKVPLQVLRGATLHVNEGECVAVLGDSGSGKSTLLHLIAGLDRPDAKPEPTIVFDGSDIGAMSIAQRDVYRAQQVGIVFQAYHLLTELTALQNVVIAGMVRHGFGYWGNRRELTQRAHELLDVVGLGERAGHRPVELSGGERQRVAIARALINQPRLLLADEPTGNLDEQTAGRVLEMLMRVREQQNLTLVMVTHSTSIASQADRTVRIEFGQIRASESEFASVIG